jgi:hypothetical protein
MQTLPTPAAGGEEIRGGEGDISKAKNEIQGAVQLTSIEVQWYAVPVHVLEWYPEILRSDKKTTISLHPDDVDAFKSIREKIGVAIYAENEETEIDGNGIHISERLIAILRDHWVIVSSAGLWNFTVSWPRQ